MSKLPLQVAVSREVADRWPLDDHPLLADHKHLEQNRTVVDVPGGVGGVGGVGVGVGGGGGGGGVEVAMQTKETSSDVAQSRGGRRVEGSDSACSLEGLIHGSVKIVKAKCTVRPQDRG